MLQEFNRSASVDARTARQDRVRLQWGEWLVIGTEEELEGYFQLIALDQPVSRELYALEMRRTLNDEEQRLLSFALPSIFTLRDGRNPTFPVIGISEGGRGGGRERLRPLFTGRLNISRDAVPIGMQPEGGRVPLSARRITASLFLNPTRFLVHQSTPSGIWPIDPQRWNPGSARMRYRRQSTHRTSVDWSLDGNDNVILSQRHESFARPEAWPIHLRRYWEGVRSLIDDSLLVAGGSRPEATYVHKRSDNINLQEVETFWEFQAENPALLVRQLEDRISSLGRDVTSREYPEGFIQHGQSGNARSIEVMLRRGVFLAVYAKTTKRIRFEIRHDLTESVAGLHQRADTPARRQIENNDRHTNADPNRLYAWLDALAEAAARDVNETLTYLHRRRPLYAPGRSAYQLMRRISAAAESDDDADLLLQLLIANGCIRTPRASSLEVAVRRLEARGVLMRPRPRSRQHVLTSGYADALDDVLRGRILRPRS